MKSEERVKILLDTDIGTDIDDAVCLAYLLSQPRCHLLGITTVTGEAVQRARLASVVCRRAGREVPIYPGAEMPLVVPQRQKLAQQAECLPRWSHETDYPAGEAVEFLRRTIRSNPGEVVLLSVAPLSNVGLLFRVDPEIPSLLRGLVMMCGRFTERLAGTWVRTEWNAAGDPHASAIVYGAPVRLHRSVGLDVTTHVHMDADRFRSAFGRLPLFEPVLDMAEIWFRDFPRTTFHDPLAAATIFDESICRYECGSVTVDLSAGEGCGETIWSAQGEAPPHEIAAGVDADRFFRHLISVVS
jgi:inosine-uridine nucleoside N-ribohydrolase